VRAAALVQELHGVRGSGKVPKNTPSTAQSQHTQLARRTAPKTSSSSSSSNSGGSRRLGGDMADASAHRTARTAFDTPGNTEYSSPEAGAPDGAEVRWGQGLDGSDEYWSPNRGAGSAA